jgi:uncharacterized surface protein with fasciclin (FAS1) repeats
MNVKKLILSTVLTAALFSTALIRANHTEPSNPTPVVENDDKKTVVGVAASNDNFSTLVAAIQAADLVSTLNSEGPFTVFAPNNEAFAKLPDGTLEMLLKAENKKTLTSILTYHVVAGKFMASDVLEAIKKNNGSFDISTVNGEKLTASLKDGKVMLKDSKGNFSEIILTDIGASNGVIHAIDTVVMP